MLGVHAQIDGQFHRFVELRVMRLLDQLRSFPELVGTRLHFLARILDVLARFLRHLRLLLVLTTAHQSNCDFYPTTANPILRAFLMTIRTADSNLVVFSSSSFVVAISSACFFVTLPTLLRFGSAEPFTIPAARSSRIDAGGVFKMNVNVRSVYTVTSTGKIIPSGSLAVFALNCLQKSMMFKPCGPSAVPTGGAGVALPAGNCNLIVVCTFLAMFHPCLKFNCESKGLQSMSSKHFKIARFRQHDRVPTYNNSNSSSLEPAAGFQTAILLLNSPTEPLQPASPAFRRSQNPVPP